MIAEYALEEYYNGKFYNQIDVYSTIQKALDSAKELDLNEYVIRVILYDENENEIDTETMFEKMKGE